MALAIVQSKSQGQQASPQSLTFTSTTTSGNLIVVGTSWYSGFGATLSSVTDSQSNTYTQTADSGSAGSARTAQWYAKNITGGASHQITVTWSGTSYAGLAIIEISGANTTTPLDQATGASDAGGTSHTSAALTTGTADEILIGVGGAEGKGLITDTGSGWTNRESVTYSSGNWEPVILDTKIVSSTGSYTYTYSTDFANIAVWAYGTYTQAAAAGNKAGPLVTNRLLNKSLVGGGLVR